MPTGTSGQSVGMGLIGFLPFLLIILIFYFLLIRPQAKKEKEMEKMRNELKKGDEIITMSGICGSVLEFRGDRIVIKVEDGGKLTLLKSSVAVVETVQPAQTEQKK